MATWRRTALLLALRAVVAAASSKPPLFVVDLSKPAERRWDGAVAMIIDRHSYFHSFEQVFATHNRTLFNWVTPQQWSAMGQAVRRHYPEAASELSGIAAQFAELGLPEVSYEYMVGWLYFHELLHSDINHKPDKHSKALMDSNSIMDSIEGFLEEPKECTGVLIQMADGSVIQGANMDQRPYAGRNLTLQVRFVDELGETVFEGVDFYALLSTGLSRAVRKGLASVQENWRHGERRPGADVIQDIEDGVVSQMLVFRHAFVSAHRAAKAGSPATFGGFLWMLSHVRLAAPFFVVTAGPDRGQGVIIARNLTHGHGTAKMSRVSDLSEPDDWFMVQANTDRWLPDDLAVPRRAAAELTLRDFGKEESTSMVGLFAVMSTYPVKNSETMFTALMSARTGELHAFIREATCVMDPSATVVHVRQSCSAPQHFPSPKETPVSTTEGVASWE